MRKSVILTVLISIGFVASISSQIKPILCDTDSIYRVVDEMPGFPGCHDIEGVDERKRCQDRSLLEYVYEHVKYPSIDSSAKIRNSTVISFVVCKSGYLDHFKVAREGITGYGDMVIAILKQMPQPWDPGCLNGVPVNVEYQFPIRICFQ